MRRAALFLSLWLAPVTVHAQAEPALPTGAFPVIQRESRRPLVVIRARTEPTWGRGRVRLLRRERPTEMARGARLGALPREVRRDLRGTVRLYSRGGEVCRARMGRPRLYRHIRPDFDYDTWSGLDGGRRWSDREVADAAWDLAEGGELLVAPVLSVRGDCSRAEWASRRGLTFSQRASVEPAAIEAFRSTEEYGWLADGWTSAREYDDDSAAEHWDARSNGAYRYVSELAIDGRRFTLVVGYGHDGCGDFTGSAWALLVRDTHGLTVRAHGASDMPPTRLVDFDGDGTPELIGHQRVWPHGAESPVDVSAPFLGCPC